MLPGLAGYLPVGYASGLRSFKHGLQPTRGYTNNSSGWTVTVVDIFLLANYIYPLLVAVARQPVDYFLCPKSGRFCVCHYSSSHIRILLFVFSFFSDLCLKTSKNPFLIPFSSIKE